MGLEHINRIGWMVIGAIFGVVGMMTWSWTQIDPHVLPVSRGDFEAAIIQTDPVSQKPLIRNIVIQPPVESEVTEGAVRVVTFERLHKHVKNGSYWWIQQKMTAETPYVPANRGRVAATPDLTIEGFLDKIAEQNPSVKYSTGWWLIPRNAAIVGGLVGIVLIGGIWPTMLALMSGAGLGRKYNPKYKDDRPLWKVKSSATVSTARPTVTQADMARVGAIADAYEHNLAQHASAGAHGPSVSAAGAEVQKLKSEQLEEVKPLPNPDGDDEIEVKGEFYPVMFHHKKEHHDHKDGDQDHPGANRGESGRS
jgi:hypothetical protein